MPTLSEISKLPRKGAEYAPTHKLTIGGDNFTEELRNIDISYTSDGGGSGVQMQLRGDISDYDNAPIVFYFGYGDEVVPYFSGRVQRPQYFHRLDYSTANAFGPYKLMADQILEDELTYDGYTLRDALYDLIARASYRRGEVEVKGGNDYTIEGGELYVWHNTLGEIANSLLEKAQYIGMDLPVGKRLFRKRPRAGVLGGYTESYSPDEYVTDAFEPTPATETSFAKVTVVRVAKDGTELGKYHQKVGKKMLFAPPPKRIYTVSDFLGNAEQAQQEARETARWLRMGDYGFSFSVPLNPTLTLFDIIQVKASHRGNIKMYKCAISGDIQAHYQPAGLRTPGVATMTMTGEAIGTKIGE